MQSNLEKDISRMKKINTLLLFLVLTPYLLGAITTVIRNKSQLLSTVVYTDQANTYSTGLQSFPANQNGTARGLLISQMSSVQGAPSSGTHSAGEISMDSTANMFFCLTGGTPGTWQQAGPPTGTLLPWTGNTTPTGYIVCDGAGYSRTTFAGLFGAICKNNTNITMTIASPCVVTWTSNPLNNNDPIKFYTSGALPTGITAGTEYFVVSKGTDGTDKFRISATPAGSAINTSGSQSGTHKGISAPYGDGFNNGTTGASTLFNVPNLKGRGLIGANNIFGIETAGSGSGQLTSGGFGANREVVGKTAGADTVTLSTTTMPAHKHVYSQNSITTLTAGAGPYNAGNLINQDTNTVGSTGAHLNLPPVSLVNWIIKY